MLNVVNIIVFTELLFIFVSFHSIHIAVQYCICLNNNVN